MKRNLGFGAVLLALFLCTSFAYSAPAYSPMTGHWYELDLTSRSYEDAKAYAASKGGYLAVITSAAENLWISNVFTAQELDYALLGGFSTQSGGSFEWINGEPWVYSNWIGIEPNNQPSVLTFKTIRYNINDLWWVPGNGYGWADNLYSSTYHALIEYDADPFKNGTTAVDNYVWVAGWFENAVFKVDKSALSATAIPVGIHAAGLTVDDKYVWVAGEYDVVRISKQDFSKQVIPINHYLSGIAVDDKFVWVGNYFDRSISRIDKTNFSITVIPCQGSSVCAVDDQYVWVANVWRPLIIRINKSDLSIREIPLPTGVSVEMIAADEKYVWATQGNGYKIVNRIDKSDLSITPISTAPYDPNAVTVDERYVWVPHFDSPFVSRIDKDDLSNIVTIGTYAWPVQISSDEKYVWVSHYQSNVVTRITKSDLSTAQAYAGNETRLLGIDTGYNYDRFSRNLDSNACIEWTTVSPLLELNRAPGAAVLDGKIYAIGGHNDGKGYLPDAEIYYPDLNRPLGEWDWIPMMRTSRAYPSVVPFDNEIWTINGKSSGYGVENSIEIYNPASGEWRSSGNPVGTETATEAAVVLDGNIYVMGGINYDVGVLDIVKMWDGTNWVDKEPIPVKIQSHAATVANGEIYLTGGTIDTETDSDRTFIYNPISNEWREGPKLNYIRWAHKMVTVRNLIFVIGGAGIVNGTKQAMDSVEVLDWSAPSGWRISECSKLPSASIRPGAVVLNNEIYILGGAEFPDNPTSIVQKGTINRPPIALCQDVTVDAGQTCTALASIDKGSYDPDGDPVTLIQNPGGSYSLGETSVTLTVTDGKGGSDTCTKTVTVEDKEKPTITPQPDLPHVNTDPGQCTASNVPLGPPVTGDNCGVASVVNNAPALFPKGNTVVTWTVTDTSRNLNSATQTVTVEDKEKPTLVLPANIVAPTDPGLCSAVVTYTISATDNCAVVTVVSNPPSGSVFPKGVTTVTVTATDAAGNVTTGSLTVTVEDREAPKLFLPESGVKPNQTCIQWTRVADLQAGNQALGAAVLDGKIYAVGGHRGDGGYLSETEVYDPATNQWEWKASMSTPRTYPAVVSYNNQIWAINGTCCGGSTPHNSTEIYDPESDSWSWGEPIGERTESMNAAVELDGKIYVVGGNGGYNYGDCRDFLKMWNGTEWVELEPSPQRLRFASHAVTVANGKIYAIGGSNCADTDYSRTFIYAPDTNKWKAGPPLNIPRLYHTAVTVGSKIFVIGGQTFTGETYISTYSVEVLDLSNSNPTWQISECSKLSFSRDFHASVVLNNQIYILGGEESVGHGNYPIMWSPVVERGTLTTQAELTVHTGLNDTSCGTVVSDEILGTVTSTDNCPGVVVTRSSVPAGNFFPVGVTTIKYGATDTADNVADGTQTVTVIDATPPTLNLPANMVVPTDPGQCSAVVNYNVTASDNCSGVTVVSIPPSGSIFPKGVTAVTVTATDATGNTTTRTFTVTVEDREPPKVTLPPNMVVPTNPGQCSAVVNYTVAVTDNCSGVTVVSNPPSGSVFSKGVTTVTVTATDASGNVTAGTFTVTVEDREPPKLTLPPNMVVPTNPGHCSAVVNYTVAVTDNCSGVTVVSNPPSGSVFSKGVTTVTVTATDASGNVTAGTFTVTVEDREPPKLTLPPNMVVPTNPGHCSAVVNYTVAVTDNCSGVTVVSNPPSGSVFSKGVTTVTVTATDASGNVTAGTFTVTVEDREPPKLTLPPNMVVPTNPGHCSAVVNYTVAVTDNCSGVTVVSNPPSGSVFSKGVTTVTVTATDASGNIATGTFTVTVEDMEPPTIIAPAAVSEYSGLCGSPCGTIVSDAVLGTATAGDNCQGVSVTRIGVPAGNFFPVGTTTITYTATDAAGNTATAAQTVTVVHQPTTTPGTFWIGLKNSDDQGTQFDLRAELYINGVLVSQGQTSCITGVTRNSSYAKEVAVPFGSIADRNYQPGDVLSLKLLTRIGTNSDGTKCSGPGGSHNNAVGLRLYYDAPSQPSGLGVEITPNPLKNLYLHSTGTTYFLNDVAPTGAANYKDSSAINYNNGNPWKEIGTWSGILP